MKKCGIVLLASSTSEVPTRAISKRVRVVTSCKEQILKKAKTFLAEFKTEYFVSNLNIDIPSSQNAYSLTCFVNQDFLKEMLKVNDYRYVHMVFPFIAAFKDRAGG